MFDHNLNPHTQFIEADDLKRYPSVIATAPASRTSSRYSFIPTTRLIEQFEIAGFKPVKIQEARTVEADRTGFQKHLIRFRQPGIEAIGEDKLFPEIVMTNSHDAAAAFRLMMGIFRMVCTNGMVVGESFGSTTAINHVGYTDQAVHDAIGEMTDRLPRIMGRVDEFKTLEMTPDDKGVFALEALAIKYGMEGIITREFDRNALMFPVRYEDRAPNLWNAYNAVQEKLIEKGGRIERRQTTERWSRATQKMEPVIRTVRTRAVQTPTANIHLNQRLWNLAEDFAGRIQTAGHFEEGAADKIMVKVAKATTGKDTVKAAREVIAARNAVTALQG